MKQQLFFFNSLIHTNLLNELRADFQAGKLTDTFLNKRYHNLSKWANFEGGSDSVTYIYFNSNDTEGYLGSAHFSDYLKDRIIYESSLFIERLFLKSNPETLKLESVDFDNYHLIISNYLNDSQNIDVKFSSIVQNGLLELLDKMTVFEPDRRVIRAPNAKLNPINKKQLYNELLDFSKGLKSFRLISEDTKIGTIRSIFGFNDITEKVIWEGPKNALRELIILLEKENKIKPLGKAKAEIISYLFEFKDDPKYDFRKLKSNNDPYSRRADLKAIVSYL